MPGSSLTSREWKGESGDAEESAARRQQLSPKEASGREKAEA